MLEVIDKATNYSNKIINDLLEYSRELRLQPKNFRLIKLLNEAFLMIQVPDRIKIVNSVDEKIRIMVDADKIVQVFTNIIKNAIDAIPEEGTLEIRSHKTGENVEIGFAYTGIGIPEKVLSKLFSPLFTTKAKGMGFGLSICKRIVEAHGGTITVKTAINHGTTFTIILPIKPKLEIADENILINLPESFLIRGK